MAQPVPEVVVTGVGVVSPIGIGRTPFWEALMAGRSGIQDTTPATHGTLPIPYGGSLQDFDAAEYVKPRKAIKMMCREVQVGQAAANMAMEDASISAGQVDPDRFGIVFGSEMLYGYPSGLREVFAASSVDGQFSFQKWGERFTHEMFPLWLLLYLPNMIACHAAIALDARGANNTIVQGTISGLLAVIEAASYIERGWTDCMLAGGCGTTMNPTRQVYLRHDQLSKHPDGPTACRPFDANRGGWVAGEGGAAVVLESRQHAVARGATILASIAGVGRAAQLADSPAGGVTREAIERSIHLALTDRPWISRPEGEIQHVSAHGLGTIDDDRREAQAISAQLQRTPVTALKSYFGSLGAGASAVELVASILALQHGAVPPTLNYDDPDPDCPVAVVRGEPLSSHRPLALVLSQAATGQSAAVTLQKND